MGDTVSPILRLEQGRLFKSDTICLKYLLFSFIYIIYIIQLTLYNLLIIIY